MMRRAAPIPWKGNTDLSNGSSGGRGVERSTKIKISGGKLLKVAVRSHGGTIEDVRITGDFFAYPEEALELIEAKLKGRTAQDVREILKEEVKSLNITIIGFKLEQLTSMIEGCSR
jgi:lipoate-protein ligase A